MLIHLSELFNCEGRKKVYTVETALDSVDFDGETFQIEKAEPFELELTAKTRHKYTMSGHATLTVGGHCARCLEPVSFDCELDFGREVEVQDGQELDMNQTKEDRIEALDEQFYINGYNLDVDQLVGNELTLNLPMRVLCSDNCKGICNRCGTNLNLRTCTCDTRSLDPRMSVIQEIFNEFKEV